MPEPRRRPVKVLHAARSLGLGGTEKTLQLLVAHLDPGRFQPAAFAFAGGERAPALRGAGVPTYIGPDLHAALQRFQPDIVHIHRAGWPDPELTRPLKRLRRASASGRAPAVVETNVFGRHDPSPDAAAIDRRLFVSRFCLDRHLRVVGEAGSQPRPGFLYNPVDTDFYAAHCPERDLNAPVIGRLSRPDPGKWSPLALDILEPLARRVPDFTCRIVGATPEVREFVAARGLERYVVFEEPKLDETDLADFFNRCSLLAHANATGETFGLAIAEAMAAGLPVVTHPCPGLKDNAQLELVDHGVTGLVAATAEEYAEAVAWLLQHPGRAREMGRAGRDKARRLYRAQTVAAQLMAVYDELLAEAPER